MASELEKLIESEGDERSWEHAGLACRMVRHDSLKHWCGYVGLPEAHPHHGKDYDSIDADVHGGLTYASDHAPKQEADGQWWVGFDCAHVGDIVPGALRHDEPTRDEDVYRTAEWVQAETNRLADQLASPA